MPKLKPRIAPLDRLAAQVRGATSFPAVFDALERELVLDPSFIRTSTPSKSAFIEEVLAHLAKKLVDPDATIRWLTPLLRHAPGQVLHGAALLGDRMAVLFYFEDHDVGLAAIAAPGLDTHFVRFSKIELGAPAVIVRARGEA